MLLEPCFIGGRCWILCHLGFRDTVPHLLYLSWLYSPLSRSWYIRCCKWEECYLIHLVPRCARTGVDMNLYFSFLKDCISLIHYDDDDGTFQNAYSSCIICLLLKMDFRISPDYDIERKNRWSWSGIWEAFRWITCQICNGRVEQIRQRGGGNWYCKAFRIALWSPF